jgi:membrane protein
MSQSRLARIKASAGARWAAAQQRWTWLRHVLAAWKRMQDHNGNQYAAAITFFSFLALFPLLLLAVSVTAFVLHSDPSTQQAFFAHLTDNVPGPLGRTLEKSLRVAIDSRTSIGIVGLAGVLITGLGWIGNLRDAIDAVWGRTPEKLNFVKQKLANLLVLVGLGVAAVLSIALTVVGTSLTDQILGWLHLDTVPGASVLLKLLGIALAVAGDMIIFWWVLVRLPRIDIPGRLALKGALLTAVGFEVLKIVGSYTIAHTANSPTAGPFAGIIAILIWIQLVARWLLFACAWTAVLADDAGPQIPEVLDHPGEPAVENRSATIR